MDSLIGLFFGSHAINRQVNPFFVVPAEPLGKRLPFPSWILIELFIHGAVHPLHLAIPIRRLLGNKEVRDMLCLAPSMEVSPKLATVVSLNGENGESEIYCRPLNCESGVFALAGRKYLSKTLLRERIKDGELIFSPALRIDVFHVELDALAWLCDDKVFFERGMPAELPLGPPNEAFSFVMAIDDGGGNIDAIFPLHG